MAATILEGMAASTALVLAALMAGDTDFDAFTLEPAMLVASAELLNETLRPAMSFLDEEPAPAPIAGATRSWSTAGASA